MSHSEGLWLTPFRPSVRPSVHHSDGEGGAALPFQTISPEALVSGQSCSQAQASWPTLLPCCGNKETGGLRACP